MLASTENVYYDPASSCVWSDLLETAFLERVFAELRILMGEAFGSYDFFVLSSQDPDVRPQSVEHPSPRKVLISLSDELSSTPAGLEPHYLAIFKCYLPREVPGANVFPFSLGYVRDVPACPPRPVLQRQISVFFSGRFNDDRLALYRALHPVYRRLPATALRAAHSLSYRGLVKWPLPADLSAVLAGSSLQFTGQFMSGLPPEEYGRRLADSRIVLCPNGTYSPETFRHLEAMRAGAVIVSKPLPDTRFYRGSPIVTVRDWASGMATVKGLLEHESRLKALQQATLSWWRDVCSETATARYMWRTLGQLPS